MILYYKRIIEGWEKTFQFTYVTKLRVLPFDFGIGKEI